MAKRKAIKLRMGCRKNCKTLAGLAELPFHGLWLGMPTPTSRTSSDKERVSLDMLKDFDIDSYAKDSSKRD